MTPFGCFAAKIKAGLVEADIGKPLLETIQRLEKEYASAGNKAEALARAARETAEDAEAASLRKADLTLRHIEAQLNVLRAVERARDIVGARRADGKAPLHLKDEVSSPLKDTLTAMLTGDKYEVLPGQLSVYHLATNIRGEAHGLMRETIAALRGKWFGWKIDRNTELETLMAVMDPGAQVAPSARIAAEAWAKTAEHMRQQFVEAGGALPKREKWGLPNPAHDSNKVRSATRETWVDFTDRLLNHEEMIDFETGRRMGPQKRRALLSEIYDTIASDGAKDGPSSAFSGQKALASRRAETRVLVFRNGESWMDYNQRFGSGAGVLETMMNHVGTMAEDIAWLRVMGPNPDAMKRYLLSLFDQEKLRLTKQGTDLAGEQAAAHINEKTANALASDRNAIENLWDEVSGANRVPQNIIWAQRWGEIRAALSASQLGSAIISSLADPARMVALGRFYDLESTKLISHAIGNMADKEFELKAAQMGLVADSAAMLLHRTDRYNGDMIRTGNMARIASTVIAASGLRRWSGVLRSTVGMEMMANLANRISHGYSELPAQFRTVLTRGGIDEAGWQVIRKAVPTEPTPGGKFLTAADIRRVDHPDAKKLADLWQQTITTAMDHLVIEGDPEARAFWTRGTKPGTLLGEAMRLIGQFKAFPTSIVMKDYAFATAHGWDGSRLGHAALTFSAMTAMGMVSFQAKEIIKGRDPITMDPTDPKGIRAWGAAALQGGGLGVFGDFFFQDQTRISTTFASTLAGPVAGAAEKLIWDAMIGNVQRLAKGEQSHFAGDILYAAAGLVPGQNLWYLRTAFQRAVVDQLALMIDDRAPQRFQRIEREAEKTWGQSFWWEGGRVGPRRTPDLSAALGR